MRKILTFLFLVAINMGTFAQQPCLQGWKYRLPVSVDNTGNTETLTDYQVSLLINTAALIGANKMDAHGADIRFLSEDGTALNHWVESGTLNTNQTKIWVRVNEIPASASTNVYLFYGSPSAISIESAEHTFDLFDGFNESTLDSNKWNSTSTGGQITAAGGALTITTMGGQVDTTTITSKAAFSTPVISEVGVQSMAVNANDIYYLGQVNPAGEGYSGTYEALNFVTTMRLSNVTPTAASQVLSNLNPVNSQQALNLIGTWKFAWPALSISLIDWPGNPGPLLSGSGNAAFSTPLKTTFGVQGLSSSITLDYFRVRKYTATEPIATPLAEVLVQVPIVNVTSNSPVCEGGNITLSVPDLVGLSYTWTGPNGFSDSVCAPTIVSAQLLNEGIYAVQMVDPGGCSVETYNVWVDVKSPTMPGILANGDTVCSGANAGTIRISGYTGTIVRWEYSTTGTWTTMANTTDSLVYNNLLQTTDYRAILNNGNCAEVATNTIRIQVDATTDKGNLFGATSICGNDNAGEIKVLNQVGSISKWEATTNEGTTWQAIGNTTNPQPYSNLDSTTWYRFEIQNGVCAMITSDTAIVTVWPVPDLGFMATTACAGNATIFTDSSTISAGIISSYTWDLGDGNSSSATNPVHLFGAPEDYHVKLTATSNQGCIDSVSHVITVNPSPVANFTFTGECEKANTAFTSLSSIAAGNITSHAWDFGDGSISADVNPNHTYANDLIYQVKLIVTSDLICKDSIDLSVSISDLPTVSLVSDNVCLGNAIDFENHTTSSGSGISYHWAFGDGVTSALENPSHTYADTGTYNVLLNATTDNGCTNALTDTVVIYPMPEVAFSADNHCEGKAAYFVNSSGIASGTQAYTWDFGDGQTDTASNPTHQYATANVYEVELIASSANCTGTANQMVRVNPLPSPNFVFDDVCKGDQADLTNLTTISTGSTTHTWKFGDGSANDSSANASHAYGSHGIFEITLLSTSDSSCVDSIKKTIEVHDVPVASFSVDEPCDGSASSFQNKATIVSDSITSSIWNFGDGSNSIVPNPIHQYLNPGEYHVILQVTSSNGCTSDTSKPAFVHVRPVARFSAAGVCVGSATSFVNGSIMAQGTMTYIWDFGNNTDTSVALNPYHAYTSAGVYEATLVATSDKGCTDTVSMGVMVYGVPVADAGIDTSMARGERINLMASGGQSYCWSPTTSLDNPFSQSPETSTLATQMYTVQVTDEFGCTAQDSVEVTVRNDYQVTAYNVLTPDGNGENDYWVIDNLNFYDNNRVTVFDRWGKPVFHQENYQNDWDGVMGKDLLPDGTYYYQITFDNTDVEYKGALTILRNQ